VADFCYFYGESAPAYVPSKDSMDPALPAGFDCDTINAEALMTRLWLEGDRLVLPDGVAYKYLILPARTWTPPPQEIFRSEQDAVPGPGNGLPPAMSAPVLRKIRELVEAGATVAGPRPLRAPGLARYPHSDSEIEALAGTLWGEGPSGERRVGKGRVIWGRTLEEILKVDRVAPDFEARGGARFDYIHRVDGATEIYFVSNQENRARRAQCLFRVTGRQPELWDPVTGEIRTLTEFSSEGGRTVVTMEFAPRQSLFVVFRAPAAARRPQSNFPEIRLLRELEGPWEVSFDPEWGGPKRVTFDHLQDWTARPEQGIRYYSGTATYRKKFELLERARAKRLFLALGTVHCLAEVRLNGRNLGVVWCAPWRVEITEAVRERDNELEIDVVNLWPNRLIGDAGLPPDKRLTKTNVATFRPGAPLLPSGLLGPVTIDAAIA